MQSRVLGDDCGMQLVYALMRLSTAKSKSIDDNGYRSSSKPKPTKVQKKVEGEIRYACCVTIT